MSNYVNRSWVETKVPSQHLLEALDDDGDGVEDDGLFDKLAESVSGDVDSIIGADATVGAALRTSAANIFFCATIYKRRGVGDAANPWAGDATKMTKKLEAIATGEQRIEPTPAPSHGTTRVVTEQAKSYPKSGRLIL